MDEPFINDSNLEKLSEKFQVIRWLDKLSSTTEYVVLAVEKKEDKINLQFYHSGNILASQVLFAIEKFKKYLLEEF